MRAQSRVELPRSDLAMVVRERLVGRLRERWFTPVMVLSAPAGHGKTTLLTQAIAANDLAPLGIDCWWTCAPGSGAATVLGEGLCRAVGAVLPQVDRRGRVEALAAAVADALWRRSPQQVALIIDDVHEIPAASEAAAVLAAVVAALPANAHVVLSGRDLPPLPPLPPPARLARRERDGGLTRLDETDLAFTEDELGAFAALRGVPRGQLAGCGGWPALAELAVSAGPDGIEGATSGFTGHEVRATMAPARRHRLALLSHLGPFDDRLARVALDEDGEDVDIDELLAGLPLVSGLAGGERSLHSLWQSWLAADATPADVAAARRRAGIELLERGGRVVPAIRRLVEAGAWAELGPAIVTLLGAAQAPVAHDVLEEWYEQLPAGVRSTPPGRLLAAVARVEADPDGVTRELEDCARDFRARGEPLGELACLVQLGQIAWWSEQPDRLASLTARGFELEAEGCEAAAPLAAIGRALLYDITDQGERMLTELDRIPHGSLSEPWLGLVSWIRAVALLQLGDAARARAAAETALTYAGSLSAPLAQGTRLHAMWFQGHLGAVCRAYPALLDSVERSGYRNSAVLVAAQSSAAHAMQGRCDLAAEHLAQARAVAALVTGSALVDTNLAIAEATLAVVSGDEATAAAVLEAYLDRHPVGQGLPVAAQRRHLALLYVLVPSSRPVWEGAALGPAWVVARDLARAMTSVREHHHLPAGRSLPLPDDVGIVRAHLPPAWAAELAVAAIAGGDRRDLGWRLVESTWPASQTAVAALAVHGATAALRQAADQVLDRLPGAPASRFDLRLLGPIELRRDGEAVAVRRWQNERTRALLVYLLLHRSVRRERVARDLWPGLDAKAAARHLRTTLTSLLQILEPERGRHTPSFFVREHDGHLSLHTGEWLTVDLWAFDDLCEEMAEADRQGAPAVALDRALAAADLWRGEPLELLSEPWASAQIERRRDRLAGIATRAGELRLAQGRHESARDMAQWALRLSPWLEAAHRLVVAIHRSTGDHQVAHRTLRIYHNAVHDFGSDLDDATRMVGRLLDHAPRS